MESKSQSFQLILSDRDGLGRISVDLETFFEFSFALAEELDAIVRRWRTLYPDHRPPIVRPLLR